MTTPPFDPQPCDTGGSGDAGIDVEGTLVCDVNAAGDVVGVALVEAVYDATGARIATRFVDPATGLTYVPQGTLQACREGCCPEPVVLCDVQTDGSAVQFIRSFIGDEAGNLDVKDTLLDGSVYAPTGVVSDCQPYTNCTPSSDQDLNGDCGPGEVATTSVILADGQAPNSVVTDDPSADALCGGSWGPGPDAQPPGFPVAESFRNATFDQPGPVIQGSAPYAGLTASPGWTGSNVDPAGDGWLQTSDINSGTNGIWQVPGPFSTAAGATASVTFASHDGTAQGGDGMAFVFTNGAPAPQGTPIGGFGNLGLQNWENGYVAVVLDEYGQTCTCDHTAPPGGPNPGPCGFCTNTISIQLAGTARQAATCECCTIATAALAPKQINATTRSAPGRLTVSIIEEAGQTYVSASVLWPGDTDATVYFNRVNVTACAGPAPASLRMALYGGSGGAYRSEHEYRDAQAIASGIQDWRAFPVTTDPIPACVTQVNIRAEVDVTFVSDTQTTGNADNEAWFWLVNTATNTVVDRAELSSLPSQTGTVHHLTIDSGLIPVADLPNYRIYVGAETRDQAGSYGHLWENLDITVSGTGCPVVPRRTLEVSARCPLPVAIVSGGGGDGGGGAPSVFNAPATFEDALVCALSGGVRSPAFRREVRTPDGNIIFSFLTTDGVPFTPDGWTPGPCDPPNFGEDILCDDNGPFVRKLIQDSSGTVTGVVILSLMGDGYSPVGPIRVCAGVDQEVVCWTQTSTGTTVHTGTIRHDDNLLAPGWILFDQHQTPVLPTEPGLTFVPCAEAMDPVAITGLCLADGTPIAAVVRRNSITGVVTQDGWINLNTGAFTAGNPPVGAVACGDSRSIQVSGTFCDVDGSGNVLALVLIEYSYNPDGTIASVRLVNATTGATYVPVGTITTCPEGTPQPEQDIEILCDVNAGVATPFIRDYRRDELGAIVAISDYTLAGAAYAPTGTVGLCSSVMRDEEILVLCDATPTRFLRRYNYDAATGALIGIVNTTLDGSTPFVPVGAVGICTTPIQSDFDFTEEVLCDANGTAFIRRFTFNSSTGAVTATTDLTLAGAAFVPVGAVGICSGLDSESFILCDSAVVPNRFLRTYRYTTSGTVAAFSDTTLAGAPFVPTGAVGICTTPVQSDFDFTEEVLCDANGTAFIRRFTFNSSTGAVTATTNLTLAGTAFTPVGAVGICANCCPTVVGEGCTNVGSGHYTAIRAANGTISLIDSVSGVAVAAGAIVVCPAATVIPSTITLNSQGRLVADADAAWTPGADVVGTLTSVTLTVLSGTATVTDQSGTVLTGLPAGYTATWTAEDHSTLLGPQSIDAIGGNTVVIWTQK